MRVSAWDLFIFGYACLSLGVCGTMLVTDLYRLHLLKEDRRKLEQLQKQLDLVKKEAGMKS